MKPLTAFLALGIMSSGSELHAEKFYLDDPLLKEPPPANVNDVRVRKLGHAYDFFYYSLAPPGERSGKKQVIPARAVNTLGDPMDGPWYVRRHYWQPMTTQELTQGVGGSTPPAMDGPWTIVAAKTQGVSAGFVMIDSKQRRYFVKFDPVSNPEMATAADMIAARFFHALGYHVYDTYLVYFNIDQLVLGADVEVRGKDGLPRKMTRRDLVEILLKAPKTKDGKYRALASLALPGKPAGPFLFYGTRSDDPNDTVPHEHRRDLRGYYVFCAWLNHDDSRAANTLDMLVEENGAKFLRHYLIDFGATLGSSTTRANSPRAGGEYLFSWGPAVSEIATLGLWVPRWARAEYPNYASIGRFEDGVFDPDRWYPEYPNPAFRNRLPDDEFWAAKQVMAFTDDQIRAIVKTGQLSDPAAEEYLADCLIRRRDKIGKVFFAKVLPLDRFAVRNGELVFENLATKHGTGETGPLNVSWSRLDNGTQKKTFLAGADGLVIPRENLTSAQPAYYVADISASRGAKRTITVYVRTREGQPAEVVGVDRSW